MELIKKAFSHLESEGFGKVVKVPMKNKQYKISFERISHDEFVNKLALEEFLSRKGILNDFKKVLQRQKPIEITPISNCESSIDINLDQLSLS